METDNLNTPKIPSRMTTVILIVILIFFSAIILGLLFIKKPDIVQGKFNIYATHMPYLLMAKSSGKICFLQPDKQVIESNTDIAYIETSGDYKQICSLEKILETGKLKDLQQSLNSVFYSSLGEVSNDYLSLLQAFKELDSERLSNIPLLDSKQSELNIDGYNKSLKTQQILLKIEQEKLSAIYLQFKSDSSLFVNNAITRVSYLQSKHNYLEQKENVSRIENEIEQLQNRISNEKENYSKINVQHTENITKEEILVRYRIDILKSTILEWKNKYVLTSPIKGKLEYAAYIENAHVINAGAEVVKVLPLDRSLHGLIYFPATNSSNVKVGSQVKLYLDNYERNENGFFIAYISSLSSSVTTNSDGMTYYSGNLKIDFNNQNKFKGDFSFTHGMSGTAEIITKEKNLFTKLFILLNNHI